MDKIRRLRITERTVIENAIIGDPSDRGDVVEIVGPDASGTIIRNCTVYGGIRIYGLGKSANDLREESKRADFTERCQAAAPRLVQIDSCQIVANRRIPIYVGPGCNGTTISANTIKGISVSSVIYLDAESRSANVYHNVVDCKSPREVISIDGSAGNKITHNTIHRADRGGVYIYRNSGENGVARHQEPRHSVIRDNEFRYTGSLWFPRATIWLSYDDLWRWLAYSWQDRRVPFGSGKSNRDFARENTVAGNKFVGKPWYIRAVKDKGRNNTVKT